MKAASKFAISMAITFMTMVFTSDAKEIRIGSWNMENLHHKENFKLTEYSEKRSANDFELLQKYASMFGRRGGYADLIALQEIGTKEAAERIFTSDKYDIYMSSRYKTKYSARKKEEGDIYTAIAVRKDRDIKVLKQKDIRLSSNRYLRKGTAIKFQIDGKKLWFVSLHLKSSCSGYESPKSKSKTNRHCKGLWQESENLRKWIGKITKNGIPIILAGDFNRQFHTFKNEGEVWQLINGVSPEGNWKFQQYPELGFRIFCRDRRTNIDWILIDSQIESWVKDKSFWKRLYKESANISDHCPISIDLEIK